MLTAFTDGGSGLRRILADAGVTTLPMLDWFHTTIRPQPLKQIATGLPADDPARGAAKVVIVEEVERLHWRIWNGKATDAQNSIDRIRAVMWACWQTSLRLTPCRAGRSLTLSDCANA